MDVWLIGCDLKLDGYRGGRKGVRIFYFYFWGFLFKIEEIFQAVEKRQIKMRICLVEGQWGYFRDFWFFEGYESGIFGGQVGIDGIYYLGVLGQMLFSFLIYKVFSI